MRKVKDRTISICEGTRTAKHHWETMVLKEIRKMRYACQAFGDALEPTHLALGTAIDEILNDGHATFTIPSQ